MPPPLKKRIGGGVQLHLLNFGKKIAPNRKQREFVERSLSFLICGEKLFSSSFGNLVDAVAGSSDKNSIKL